MRDLESALNDIRAIAKSRDTKALSAIVFEIEVIVNAVDVLPDVFVVGLSEILRDVTFLSVTDSWKVVKFFYDSWEQLTSDQCEGLRSVLISSFDKYGDWMGAFVTVEILGEPPLPGGRNVERADQRGEERDVAHADVGLVEPVVDGRLERERERLGVRRRRVGAAEGFDAGLQEFARPVVAVAKDRSEIAEALRRPGRGRGEIIA